MKNIFKKIVAALLVCMLFASSLPLSGFATEEGVEPVVEASVSAPVSEPEPKPEPKPEPEPKPAPEPKAEPEPESAPAPESEPEPAPEPKKEEEKPASAPEKTPEEPAAKDSSNESVDETADQVESESNNTPAASPSEKDDGDALDEGNGDAENTTPPSDGSAITEDNVPSADESSDPAVSPEAGSEEGDKGAEPSEAYIVSFAAESFSSEKKVPYGTSAGDIGFPSVLKAEWSDGSVRDVKVTWNCIDDGSGGKDYQPAHANHAAVFTFKAVLPGNEPCNAELPAIYVSYDPLPEPAAAEPLAWKDVIVEIEEKEYEVSYKSIALNVQKGYELGLSVTEDKDEEPNPELKAKVDDEEKTHNIITFKDLESDTEYTVWAKLTDTEEWTGFEDPIETDKVSVKIVRQEDTVESGDVPGVGETISVLTNLEEPAYKWYRSGQSDSISNEGSYVLTAEDAGMGIKCVVSEGKYSAETAEVQVASEEPDDLQENVPGEMMMAVFSRAMPAGEGGLDGELAAAALEDAPVGPELSKIVFTAGSQRSIDFSYTDLTGFEFAYRETGTEEELKPIVGNPEVIDGLKMHTDYTLFFRSVASGEEAVSEWEEVGLHAMTDLLEVAIAPADSIYFDGTIAASPAKNYAFAEGYPLYQAYLSDSDIFDGNAKLQGEVKGAELKLQELGVSKADIGKYIFISLSDGYGNTSAGKAVQLRRRDDPLLSLNVGERIKVGDTVEAQYNGENAEVVWEWLRGEEIIAGANAASYTATVEDANSVLTVNVIQNGAVIASGYVAVDMCALTAVVDYVQETITISVNEAVSEGYTLRVTDENGVCADRSWPADTLSVSYKLSELGIDPDAHDAYAPDYAAVLSLLNEAGEGETLRLTLPTRREYSGTPLDMNAVTRSSAAELAFVVPSGINMALSPESGVAPDFGLGSGPSFSLKEGTKYKVWLQDAAVPGVSFAGKWKDMHAVATETRKEVSVTLKASSITWSPDMELPGINISNSDVSKNDIGLSWQGGEPVNAGKHTLQLSLRGNAAKWYKLKETKLTLTIEPIAMTAKNTRVTCEQLTYNGKEQLPQKMKVIVDGIEIPASSFQVEKVSGYDCTKAGSHIIRVVGSGNVSGGIKILYVISAAKPAAIVWPTASYLVTGQQLSESKLTGGSTSAGSFAWENGSILPGAGISKHNVVFTPADTTNYDWSGITMVKPLEVKVYYVAPSDDGSMGTDSEYNYDFSASTGYWDDDFEEGEAENSSEQLAEAYLNAGSGSADVKVLEIVYDVAGQPMDYELLPIMREFEGIEGFTDHIFMVAAQPDEEGEIVSRFLRLSLAQLDYLYRDLEFSNLLFRNGDAELYLHQEELFTGDAAKLAAYMLSSDEGEIDLMNLDFESMEEPVLSRNSLMGLWLEARIDPVVVMGDSDGMEKDAWDVSLWLCTDYTEVDISTLIPSFTVCLNVNGLYEEMGQERFLEENSIALVDEADEKMLLQSELIQMPGELPVTQPDEAEYYTVLMPGADDAVVWTDYIPDMNLNAYRNSVLAVPYAGTGMYMLAETETDF